MTMERSERTEVDDGSFQGPFPPMFSRPHATALTWPQALDFLAPTLGG